MLGAYFIVFQLRISDFLPTGSADEMCNHDATDDDYI